MDLYFLQHLLTRNIKMLKRIQIGGGGGSALSPLIKNIDKFNYWLEALPFYMNVQREGVVLSEF